MFPRLATFLLAWAFAGTCAAQEAAERVEKVPARITDMYGKRIEREITVTVFEVAGRAPYPLLVLNHGRPADDAARAKMGRQRYPDASRWFASRGYSVWVPTRIGYGVSGADEDPEYTGPCTQKRYEPGFAAAADQVLQVIEHAARRAEIDAKRTIVVGQSFGGATSMAVAGRGAPGILAAVNFAGGSGGDPKTRPGEPCAPEKLRDLYSAYGKTARVPTLWIYTENDRYFGPAHSKAWFEAFRASGGTGEFVMHPAHGEDGHSLFVRGPTLWQPIVERFLAGIKKAE